MLVERTELTIPLSNPFFLVFRPFQITTAITGPLAAIPTFRTQRAVELSFLEWEESPAEAASFDLARTQEVTYESIDNCVQEVFQRLTSFDLGTEVINGYAGIALPCPFR